MTTRTRYFVIVSLLVLGVGVGTGLLAYYVGFPTSASSRAAGPDGLRFVPRNATLVAYANVQEVMTSSLRERLRQALPIKPDGQRQLENETGINVETDIDRVVACVAPAVDATSHLPAIGLVLARGRFDQVKIEALMREHGAVVEEYKGGRLITARAGSAIGDGSPVGGADSATGQADSAEGARWSRDALSVAFIEPGLVGLGSTPLVRNAIDLKAGGDNVTANEEVMGLVTSLESGNVWAVGRFDALISHARLPGDLAGRLSPITWFSASSHVDGGLSGVLRAETRDDESATNLRDVIRGLLGLAKMQAGSRPEMLALVQSLRLSGTGKTVSLSFDVPVEVFNLLGPALNRGRQNVPPPSPR
jgi:hypothetical protein